MTSTRAAAATSNIVYVVSFAGKTAVVTGAGYGIGRELAVGFAAEGARLALVDEKSDLNEVTAELIRQAGGECITLTCDVTRRDQVQAAVDATVKGLGSLDILVANAGIAQHHHFLDITDEEWDRTLAVNTTGVFYCGQIAARAMVDAGTRGRIIVITTVVSQITNPGSASYAASKAGAWMLARSMAMDLAASEITVNAIAPGVILTGRNGARLSKPENLKEWTDVIPVGRIGYPSDVLAAALYLASDEASFVTGTQLVVDGGWTIRAGAGPGGADRAYQPAPVYT